MLKQNNKKTNQPKNVSGLLICSFEIKMMMMITETHYSVLLYILLFLDREGSFSIHLPHLPPIPIPIFLSFFPCFSKFFVSAVVFLR